ncbi:o-succinylbenzoate synthase [Pseudalkalibacillus berkeleyi]|uniref:o-succinylbenzoate synthase n=1 Tax=Pseudalkalibacillus berkeleyi TaxID=1069813 RepID=A0ABS9H396_9BACL|nr:o-succinylbenzoate synthase [Pseudalkalibacillus berkeleyi]MCF6138389.1 o-succinylbenzoate synthase [Pseudalkalibacillus berkeleyi]
MNVRGVTLYKIKLPLKQPFVTAIHTVSERKLLIVAVEFSDGWIGWGECSAFDMPWYTEETTQTCQYALETYLIPELLGHGDFDHPREIHTAMKRFKGHHMAKSSIETAVWDGYAKSVQKSLFEVLGSSRKSIEVGTAIGMQTNIDALLNRIEEALETGYKRIKLKVKPNQDLDMLSAVRSRFPNAPLMVDANSSYHLSDLERLKEMDAFNLMMIEQPLGSEDFVEHSKLQQALTTPICLDESITSFGTAQTAVALNSARIIAIKHSRVGGHTEAIRIHDFCKMNGIDVWAGGMIETGIGKAHNIALASLDGFVYPGDIASSSKYWHQDIIKPEIEVKNGQIALSDAPGIGYEVDLSTLERYSEEIKRF